MSGDDSNEDSPAIITRHSGGAAPAPGDQLPWWRNPWIIALLSGLIFLPLLRPFMRNVPEPPPVLLQLPDFALITQDGAPFTRESLHGGVFVVGLFFADCPSPCPLILSKMKGLHDRFETYDHDIKLLAITVNPEADDPARLKEVGIEYGANFERWTFLTGTKEMVRHVVVDGFATYLGDREEVSPGVFDIAHAAKLILVDGDGGVRGFYPTDEEGLDEVYHRAQHVLREQLKGEQARRP